MVGLARSQGHCKFSSNFDPVTIAAAMLVPRIYLFGTLPAIFVKSTWRSAHTDKNAQLIRERR